MLHLHAKNEPMDAITLADELRWRQVYDGLPGGGVAFLMALGDVTFTTANVGYYARIVRDKALLRGLIDTGGLIAGLGYSDPPDVAAALAEAEKRVLALGHGREAGAWQPLSGLLNASMEALDARYHAGGQITGLRTGFIALDLLLGGLREGDLVIVAGRPSMGKTSIAVNAATFAALHEGKRVAFVSLEMSADQITDKIVCAEASVDTQRHQNGRLSDEEWQRLHDANLRLWDAPLLVEDTPDLSVPEIRSRCQRFVAEQGGVDLVIVDYLQLIRAEGRGREPRSRSHQDGPWSEIPCPRTERARGSAGATLACSRKT
jgi:replicative DNA helicase